MSEEDAVAKEENIFEELVAGYKRREDAAGWLATLVGVYNAAFAAMLLAVKNSGHDLPKHAYDAAKERK